MQHNDTMNWNYPTRVWFGQNSLQALPSASLDLSMKNPLFITDLHLATLPIVKEALSICAEHALSVSIFSDVKSNPVAKNIQEGVKRVREGKHDGIITMGGGSALDCAKTIALTAFQDRPLWDYEDVGDNYKRIDEAKILPLIAIPTTAGTGSEVGRAALIIDEDRKQKRFIFHPEIIPNIVIADPCLTVDLPAHLTAATGMDALAHNLEAFCVPGFHPMADGIALEGLRLIKENLLLAYHDGHNISARSKLMAASIMGGTAFQKGLGAVHSLSHPVGAIYNHHHGVLNAIFMPYVLQYNRPAIEDKMARLANYIDLPEKTVNGVINWLVALCKRMDIPTTLEQISVDDTNLQAILEQAMADPSTSGNPREMNEAAFREIFIHAKDGCLA